MPCSIESQPGLLRLRRIAQPQTSILQLMVSVARESPFSLALWTCLPPAQKRRGLAGPPACLNFWGRTWGLGSEFFLLDDPVKVLQSATPGREASDPPIIVRNPCSFMNIKAEASRTRSPRNRLSGHQRWHAVPSEGVNACEAAMPGMSACPRRCRPSSARHPDAFQVHTAPNIGLPPMTSCTCNTTVHARTHAHMHYRGAHHRDLAAGC